MSPAHSSLPCASRDQQITQGIAMAPGAGDKSLLQDPALVHGKVCHGSSAGEAKIIDPELLEGLRCSPKQVYRTRRHRETKSTTNQVSSHCSAA